MNATPVPSVFPEDFDQPAGFDAEPDPGLVKREPAMTSGTMASITTLVVSVAIILKHAYGIELGNEITSAVVDIILAAIGFISPLLAAKFTRERVTPLV